MSKRMILLILANNSRTIASTARALAISIALVFAARISLRLMKALAFIRITRTPGESSFKVTRPERSASVRKFSGFGTTFLSAHPTRTKRTEASLLPLQSEENGVLSC